MPCSVCGAPLFTWEAEGGVCREHGLQHAISAHDLGSILPPLPLRDSVRVVHRVLQPTEEELRALVAQQQPLTPAMREPRDFVIKGIGIDPVTRQANGEDKRFRIVER